MIKLGELKRLSPRQVWGDEARDFTPWLAENLPRLSEVLGMELELNTREAGVGDFSCDLLAKDLGTGHIVIIENQFGPTDHDHLGKLLTYAAGLEAEAIVWVAEKVREEHRQTLEWLNRHTDAGIKFFALVVEVLQIDTSPPAVNFKPVVFPNEWQRTTKESATGASPRGEAYRRYFQALLDELREQHRFTNARVGQPNNWYSFRSGISGVDYSNSFAQGNRFRTEVYIDFCDAEANKALFDRLLVEREALERAFGEPLTWERLDERRASRIATYRPGSIDVNPEELATLRDWAIDRLLRFRTVFGPKIRELLDTAPNMALQPTAAVDEESGRG
ncbi:MAG: DUF4268 domain-containing protein [Acidobacteria bacterium]|nr:DUF4268 domain-containing protein [Acidobacteriota bacterium]